MRLLENGTEVEKFNYRSLLRHMNRSQLYKQSHGLCPPLAHQSVVDQSGFFIDLNPFHRLLLTRRGYHSTKIISGRHSRASTFELEIERTATENMEVVDWLIMLTYDTRGTLNISTSDVFVDDNAAA